MIQQLIIFLSIQYVASLINAGIETYLINKGKHPNHAVNLIVFIVIIAIQLVIGWYIWWFWLLFIFTACLQRRVVFGIGLNLMRRVKNKLITWYYISLANPPEAWLDRKEIAVFGYNGKAIHTVYIFLWIVFTISLFILIHLS